MARPEQLKNSKKRTSQEIEAEISENLLLLDDYQQRWMGGVPPRYRLEASRIFTGRITAPKKFIRMKCLDCVGFEDSVLRIRKCHVRTCPLWRMRPFQKEDN